jgi:hypothetical protein
MALFAAHPWAADISTVRPPLGPGQMAKYEHELSALDQLGLEDIEMDAALTYLLSFVQGCARAAADAQAVRRDSALGDAEWWASSAPLLARFVDERAYPTAVRVGAAAGAAHGLSLEAAMRGAQTLLGHAAGLERLEVAVEPLVGLPDVHVRTAASSSRRPGTAARGPSDEVDDGRLDLALVLEGGEQGAPNRKVELVGVDALGLTGVGAVALFAVAGVVAVARPAHWPDAKQGLTVRQVVRVVRSIGVSRLRNLG